MGIRGRARRGKKEERRFLFSYSLRAPCLLAFSLPLFREPVDALDRHLEIITDIHSLLSPVLHMCGKIGWLWPLLFQLLTGPKLLRWSGIISVMRTHTGSRLVVDDSSPTLSQGQKTRKIYRLRFALVKEFELDL